MANKKNEEGTKKQVTNKKATKKAVVEETMNVTFNLPKEETEVLDTDFNNIEIDENKIEEREEALNTEVLKEKKKPSLFKRITKIISWIILAILAMIGGLLIAYIGVNKVAQAKGQTPPLGLYTIISPSMTPQIQVYDVVFVVETKPEDIQIGDVISYYSSKEVFNNIPITHRVIEKYNTAQGVIFRTQGDANPVPDDEFVMSGSVVGVVKSVIPQLGRVQFFLSSKGGWIVAVLIPAVGILIYDFIKLIRLIKARKEMITVRKAISE